ncbi:MAG: MYXO-CTERM sorting domain-containing protein, partial [Myxococcales bacterium]
FVAPASGAVVLQLVVSDGLLSSDPARVTIQAGGGGGCVCTSSPDLGSMVPALAFFAFVIGRRRRR